MKRALVLDADQRCALAVARSLGSHGVTVHTASDTAVALAGSSSTSREYFRYPSPRLEPAAFIEALAGYCKTQAVDILLPITELTTRLLLRRRTDFPVTVLPFPELDTIDALADKNNLMRMAETLQVPVPRTWYVNTPGRLPCDLEELPWPMVFKPGMSWQFLEGRWQRAAVRVIDSPSAARDLLQSDPAFTHNPYMIQEFVPGRGQGVFALYNRGEALAFFAHRRLREKPPGGGVSVLSESITPDPALLAHARRLLDTVGWHGVAMVEFRVADDGTPWLMEVNTRFWGSLQLAVDAGVDFPWLLYQIACDETPDPVTGYRTGLRLRWLLGDLDSLYLVLRDRQVSGREKRARLREFLTPRPASTRHEVNRWQDPGPAWFELKAYIQDIIG